MTGSNNVVPLFADRRRHDVQDQSLPVARGSRVVLAALAWMLARALRLVACAVLVLCEPLVRMVLVGGAFAVFGGALLLGLLLRAPGFPLWGMFGLAIAMLLAYWGYVTVLMFMLRGPRA